jgi:hypothetical protein
MSEVSTPIESTVSLTGSEACIGPEAPTAFVETGLVGEMTIGVMIVGGTTFSTVAPMLPEELDGEA